MTGRTWHIVPKITEVDRWVTPGHRTRVVEVHPEVSCRLLDPRVRAPRTDDPPDGRGPRMEIVA